jgi:RHS repeat-associated protein
LKSCKRYEYKDHLGNVRVVSNDIKSRAVSTLPFTTKICNFANYYPFGMQQTGTAGSYDLSSDYRYGYNGKEEDNEIKTNSADNGKSLDYGARWYDPRKARWDMTDPYEAKYPSLSPYVFAANSPITVSDIGGEDVFMVHTNLAFSTIMNLSGQLLGNDDVMHKFQQGGLKSSQHDVYITITSVLLYKEQSKTGGDIFRVMADFLGILPKSVYSSIAGTYYDAIQKMKYSNKNLVWSFDNLEFLPLNNTPIFDNKKINSAISFNDMYMTTSYFLDGKNPSEVKTVSDVTDRMVDRVLYAIYAVQHEASAHIDKTACYKHKAICDHANFGNDAVNPETSLTQEYFNELVENFKTGDGGYLNPNSDAAKLIQKLIDIKSDKSLVNIIKQNIVDMANKESQQSSSSTTEK